MNKDKNESHYDSISEIIKAAAAGEQSGKVLLYRLLKEKSWPIVLAYVKNRNGSREDAEDKFQDGVLILLDAVENGKFKLRKSIVRSHADQLSAYLMQTVKNLWKKELRWRARPPLPFETEESPNFEFFSGMIAEKFEDMQDACQTLLTHFFLQKKSPRIIGNESGLSTEEVKTQLAKCTNKLLKDVGQLQSGDFADNLSQILKTSVETLESRCQELLQLFYFDKKNMTEIALKMGYANARSATEQKNKCMKHLQKAAARSLLKM